MMELGAQLYTLRNYTQNEKDLAYTLGQVARMGYRQVQISAIGPIAPERVRELCDANGLAIVLTHTNPDRIMNDTEAVIKEHDILGCRYIGIGAMPERYRAPEWLPRFAEDYRAPAQRIAAAGKLLMYHNHDFEFEKHGGARIIESLTDAFGAEELGFTLDTYWVQAAGGDPAWWIEKLWDRIPCVHLKDMDMRGRKPVMAPVMEGNMNFEAIIRKLKEKGATKHLLVEQDICLESPFACLQKSYGNLAALLARI
ncbi:MAG: sugar phosphate isomerase/epimerase [Clostridiales bacterium]|nr:sugar phosphate isomerase/epimerase [Clostridiales bacterium]